MIESSLLVEKAGQETKQDLRANSYIEYDCAAVKHRAVRRLHDPGFRARLQPMAVIAAS